MGVTIKIKIKTKIAFKIIIKSAIYILNMLYAGKEHLWLQGGNGGIGTGGKCGGNGGWGRVRVDAVMFVGQLPLQSSLLNLFNSTTHYQVTYSLEGWV